MTKIKSLEIRNEIAKIWPNCYTLNTDMDYDLPNFKELKKIIKETESFKIENLNKSDMCDDISIILWGRVKEIRNKLAKTSDINMLSWPLGICFGTSFNGWPSPHWQNLCFTTDGLYLIEGQTFDFWKPSFPDDNVFFVLI
jgi:hypothetical protein